MESYLKWFVIFGWILVVVGIVSRLILPLLGTSFTMFSGYFMFSFINPLALIVILIGFIIIGKKTDLKWLKISSYLLLFYSIFSLLALIILENFGLFYLDYALGIGNLIFPILFATSLFKLKKYSGTVATLGGIMFIILSLFVFSGGFLIGGLGFIDPLPYIFLLLILGKFKSEPLNEESNRASGKGYSKSLKTAFIVAIVGAIFEAVTGFVTYTLMPDILFVIVNTVLIFISKDSEEKKGLGLGYLNLFIVVIISLIVFLIVGLFLMETGWYDICSSCGDRIPF